MFDFTKADDLQKASRSLGGFFTKMAEDLEKAASSAAYKAAHYEKLAKLHKARQTDHEDMCKAMADDHELKGHMTKGVGFHKAAADHCDEMAKSYKDEEAKCKTQISNMKAVAAEFGGVAVTKAEGGTSENVDLSKAATLDERIGLVTAAMTTKAMESIQTDPRVGDAIQKLVLEQIEKAIGGKLVPMGVSGVAPQPDPGLRLVRRDGAPDPAKEHKVPLEFAKLVSADDDERVAS